MKRIIILVLLLILVGCSFTNVEETTNIKDTNPTQDVDPSLGLFYNVSAITITSSFLSGGSMSRCLKKDSQQALSNGYPFLEKD